MAYESTIYLEKELMFKNEAENKYTLSNCKLSLPGPRQVSLDVTESGQVQYNIESVSVGYYDNMLCITSQNGVSFFLFETREDRDEWYSTIKQLQHGQVPCFQKKHESLPAHSPDTSPKTRDKQKMHASSPSTLQDIFKRELESKISPNLEHHQIKKGLASYVIMDYNRALQDSKESYRMLNLLHGMQNVRANLTRGRVPAAVEDDTYDIPDNGSTDLIEAQVYEDLDGRYDDPTEERLCSDPYHEPNEDFHEEQFYDDTETGAGAPPEAVGGAWDGASNLVSGQATVAPPLPPRPNSFSSTQVGLEPAEEFHEEQFYDDTEAGAGAPPEAVGGAWDGASNLVSGQATVAPPLPPRPNSFSGVGLWKTKKKRRSVDRLCSSFLVLVKSSLHMIMALPSLLAGSPVLVGGSASTESVTLQAGHPAVIPFDIPFSPDNTSQFFPVFTLGFESKPRPFYINGEDDIEGFKFPSQFHRFTTSVAEMASSFCVSLNIDPVDIVDEDRYVLLAFFHGSGNVGTETVIKEILVEIPPGRAKCFITINENKNYPYELRCQAATGSSTTTLTCYQNDQRVEVEGEITDDGQVTRGVFLLPDHSPFSCCSHDVTSAVNVTMCNHFEWPPSNNHISHPTVNDPNLTPSGVNTIAPIGNSEQASNTIESQVDSGTCKQYMASSVSLTMGMMIYRFLCC